MTSYYETSYPPSLWEGPTTPTDGRDSASPGDSFTDGAITAQDATNAAKLGPIGFVADPLTAWTVGQNITVNTFLFHWNGTAWVAGAAPVAAGQGTDPDDCPPDSPTAPEGTGTAQEAPGGTQDPETMDE